MKKQYVAPQLGQEITFLTTAVLENASGAEELVNPSTPTVTDAPARKLYI